MGFKSIVAGIFGGNQNLKEDDDAIIQPTPITPEPVASAPIREIDNFLGEAAIAEHAAKAAIKSKKFDEAWRLLHVQQEFYVLHANKQKYTASQSLALLSTINMSFANILRLEKKHHDALVNVMYACACHSGNSGKLQAYVNRCKFKGITIDDVSDFINDCSVAPDMVAIQAQVSEWRQASV